MNYNNACHHINAIDLRKAVIYAHGVVASVVIILNIVVIAI